MDKESFVDAMQDVKRNLWVLTPETVAELDLRIDNAFSGRASARKASSTNIFEAKMEPMSDDEFIASSKRDLYAAASEISADAYFAAVPKSAALQVLNGLSTRISGYMGNASVILAECATFTLSEYCRRYNAAHPDDQIATHIDD